MNIILLILFAFITGIMASLGLGGGMILIVFLTVFNDMGQQDAQGMNLLFFIPIAALALVMHSKSKLVKWQECLPAILCGTVFAIAGTAISNCLETSVLSKLFAGFITIIGIKELFYKKSDA